MNTPHSIAQKLKNTSKKLLVDFNLILARYGVERLLYRLSQSEYSDKFILKGASMFLVWQGQNLRVTRDVDLLGFGNSSVEEITTIFRNVFSIEYDKDGLSFSSKNMNVVQIKDADEYSGVRVTTTALLGNIRIPVQVDIGFGDAVTPKAEIVEYPTLIEDSPIEIKGYSPYTLAAEKIEAMVKLGIANSRMKDFYDLCILSRLFEFDGELFTQAVLNTFKRRGTKIPTTVPFALSEEFYSDASKKIQWKAFVKKAKLLEEVGELEEIVSEIKQLILPLFDKTAVGKNWKSGWIQK